MTLTASPAPGNHSCGHPLDPDGWQVPEKWAQRYPALRGLCRACTSKWLAENLPEDRPQHKQQRPPADGGPGWLDGVMDGGA